MSQPSVMHSAPPLSMVPSLGSLRPPIFGRPFSYISVVSILATEYLRCGAGRRCGAISARRRARRGPARPARPAGHAVARDCSWIGAAEGMWPRRGGPRRASGPSCGAGPLTTSSGSHTDSCTPVMGFMGAVLGGKRLSVLIAA
jgi:hypothetical protein